MENFKRMSRGGARKGAGRKPAPKRDLKAITVRIDRETAEALAEYCKAQGVSVRQFIEQQAELVTHFIKE
jgi:predicted HicB family RNase H-like nuclease